ncbi:MAG: exodeoxyribonuclease III [Candidatus Shapirobacteria bacterium]|nr:exodeoxyribonuclease III [Candidatus Shapirobacteria bacterium]
MKKQKICLISWNVNGIRAGAKKGLWQWMKKDNSNIYCFQETKAKAEQVPNTLEMPTDYFTYWNSAEKAGYSGVATFTKLKPIEVINGMRLPRSARNDDENEFEKDTEGRVVTTKFKEFTLLNVYFPNGKRDVTRLNFKMEFYEYFLKYINKLRKNGEKIVFCGDVNTAHQEIDLARPKENEKISGFLKIEREWMDKLEANGYIDTFRVFHKGEADQYSWWSQRTGARKRNVGWRIDYFFVSEDLKDKIKNAFIMPEIEGSDHCPVGIEVEV